MQCVDHKSDRLSIFFNESKWYYCGFVFKKFWSSCKLINSSILSGHNWLILLFFFVKHKPTPGHRNPNLITKVTISSKRRRRRRNKREIEAWYN